jgi:cell division protein FtsL
MWYITITIFILFITELFYLNSINDENSCESQLTFNLNKKRLKDITELEHLFMLSLAICWLPLMIIFLVLYVVDYLNRL